MHKRFVMAGLLVALSGCSRKVVRPPATSEPFIENPYLDLEPDSKLRIVLPLPKAEFEIAHYHVAGQRRGRVVLQFLSAEVSKDGKTLPETRPPVLPFAVPP